MHPFINMTGTFNTGGRNLGDDEDGNDSPDDDSN